MKFGFREYTRSRRSASDVSVSLGGLLLLLTWEFVVGVVIFGGSLSSRLLAAVLQLVVPRDRPLSAPSVPFVDVCKRIFLPLLICNAKIYAQLDSAYYAYVRGYADL